MQCHVFLLFVMVLSMSEPMMQERNSGNSLGVGGRENQTPVLLNKETKILVAWCPKQQSRKKSWRFRQAHQNSRRDQKDSMNKTSWDLIWKTSPGKLLQETTASQLADIVVGLWSYSTLMIWHSEAVADCLSKAVGNWNQVWLRADSSPQSWEKQRNMVDIHTGMDYDINVLLATQFWWWTIPMLIVVGMYTQRTSKLAENCKIEYYHFC